MKLDSEGLRELYQRETARSARHSAGDCLTEDMLARAAAGELNQSERERTADHLTTCSDCAKEYQALKTVKTWADEASTDVDSGTIPLVISENGLHNRTTVTPFPGPQTRPRSLSFYFPYAIAAAALVLSFILGALLISKSRENNRLLADAKNRQSARTAEEAKTAEALAESRRLLEETNRRVEQESAERRRVEEELARRNAAKPSSVGSEQTIDRQRTAPDVNMPIIDLSPRDVARGDQNQKAATVELASDTDLFTLILNLSGDDSRRGYSLEVSDTNNKTIWVSRELRKSAYNNFTVAMRRRSFPPGEYRLKIYGLRDGRRELVEEYAIRLTYR